MTEPKEPTGTTPPATPPTTPPATPPASTPPSTPPTPPTPPEEKIEEDVNPEVIGADDKGDDEYKIPEDLDTLDAKQVGEVINKSVESRMNKVRNSVLNQTVNNEVRSIIDAHPEYKPYAKRISNWVNHPNRMKFIKQGFPVSAVVSEAISPYLEKIGAEKARIADKKAKESAGDGGTPTPKTTTTKTDYKAMSDKEFENLTDKVKSGRYNSS